MVPPPKDPKNSPSPNKNKNGKAKALWGKVRSKAVKTAGEMKKSLMKKAEDANPLERGRLALIDTKSNM